MRVPRMLLLAASVSAACGGDAASPNPPPPPPPPPVPVASVTVTPASTTLVPQQSAQLTANVADAVGNALTGRSVTWSSSSPLVATVTASGEVTAVATGSATITATSEDKSGSASITVNQGGFVGTSGGVVTSTDGAVRLEVPAGAVPAGVALTITPTNDPEPLPAGTTAVRGTTYVFGPEGTQFAIPVTVTIKYDPASLPPWVIPGDFVLQRRHGTQWSELTDLVVDPVAHTVTGRTPGFSTVGVYFLNPTVTLTPTPAKVNAIQRSVGLTAEVSGEGRLPDALQYQWTNTGAHGNLSAPSGSTIQYTAVTPILPPGDIDGVRVVVKGQFEPDGPFEVIGEASTTVRSDLDLTFQLLPTRTVVPYSGTAQFTARVFDRTGNVAYEDDRYLRYEWNATTTAGTTTPDPQRTTVGVATYTAYPPSQQSSVSPKGDKITVKVFLLTENLIPLLGGGFRLETTTSELGQAEAFVQVIPQYQVSLVPQSASLQAGQSATFQVKLEPAWAEDEQLFFQWRTTGSQGALSVTQGAPLTQGSVTYTASQEPTGGTDFVDVDVLVGTIGRLGSARASVSVEARKTTVQGSFFITPPIGLDTGRQCVEAYIVFPLVEGAKAYEMHAYGFNDPSFWHTDIQETFTVPLPVTRDCSLSGWGLTGSNGSQFRFYLTGFAGPTNSIGGAIASFQSRFAGMQVDVTVRY